MATFMLLGVFILLPPLSPETLGCAEGRDDPDGNGEPDGDEVSAETGLGVMIGAAVSSTGESDGSTGARVGSTGAALGGAGIDDSQPQRSTIMPGRNGHWLGGTWPTSPAVWRTEQGTSG